MRACIWLGYKRYASAETSNVNISKRQYINKYPAGTTYSGLLGLLSRNPSDTNHLLVCLQNACAQINHSNRSLVYRIRNHLSRENHLV